MPVHVTKEGFLRPLSGQAGKREDTELVTSLEEWEQIAGAWPLETAGGDLEQSAERPYSVQKFTRPTWGAISLLRTSLSSKQSSDADMIT